MGISYQILKYLRISLLYVVKLVIRSELKSITPVNKFLKYEQFVRRNEKSFYCLLYVHAFFLLSYAHMNSMENCVLLNHWYSWLLIITWCVMSVDNWYWKELPIKNFIDASTINLNNEMSFICEKRFSYTMIKRFLF